jgi:hypothetical protein
MPRLVLKIKLSAEPQQGTANFVQPVGLDRFFPSVVPDVVVTERGEANIRAFTN